MSIRSWLQKKLLDVVWLSVGSRYFEGKAYAEHSCLTTNAALHSGKMFDLYEGGIA